MAGLTDKTISATYQSLLKLSTTDQQNFDGTARNVVDGEDTASCLSLTDASTGQAILSIDGSHTNGTTLQIDNSHTTGDVTVEWQLGGTTTWIMGIDDSVSNDPLSICHHTALATDQRLTFTSTETVFNEDQNDIDFRIEGNTGSHVFFVNGATDRIGIGTDSILCQMDFAGSGVRAGIHLKPRTDDSTRSASIWFTGATTADGWSIYQHESGGNDLRFAHSAEPGVTQGTTVFRMDDNVWGPNADEGADLGSVGLTWDNLYTVSPIHASDGRFKKDITNTVLGLEFINKLRPISYVRKDKEILHESPDPSENYTEIKKHSRRHYGLIAQEVKTVLDDLGIDTKDFAGYVDGNITDGVDKLFLRYSEFISPMMKAIQELSAKVIALENA